MTVLVSLPYWRTPWLLRRAVDSVLAQTHRDLILVVTNDGDQEPWNRLEDIKDSRLVLFSLSKNRGRYYADQVALEANPFDLFTVHDADDWSESTRLETLHDLLDGWEAVCDGFTRHGLNGQCEQIKTKPELVNHRAQRGLWHIAHHKALWRTETIRQLGMMPRVRVGWDTYLMHFAVSTVKVNWLKYYGYHQERQKTSLTQGRATGIQSKLRIDTVALLEGLWKGFKAEPERLGELLQQPQDVADAVQVDAERLQRLL